MRVLHKLDDVGFTRQGMINMELPGSSRRGRSQKKIMNVVKDGMQKVGGIEVDC